MAAPLLVVDQPRVLSRPLNLSLLSQMVLVVVAAHEYFFLKLNRVSFPPEPASGTGSLDVLLGELLVGPLGQFPLVDEALLGGPVKSAEEVEPPRAFLSLPRGSTEVLGGEDVVERRGEGGVGFGFFEKVVLPFLVVAVDGAGAGGEKAQDGFH